MPLILPLKLLIISQIILTYSCEGCMLNESKIFFNRAYSISKNSSEFFRVKNCTELSQDKEFLPLKRPELKFSYTSLKEQLIYVLPSSINLLKKETKFKPKNYFYSTLPNKDLALSFEVLPLNVRLTHISDVFEKRNLPVYDSSSISVSTFYKALAEESIGISHNLSDQVENRISPLIDSVNISLRFEDLPFKQKKLEELLVNMLQSSNPNNDAKLKFSSINSQQMSAETAAVVTKIVPLAPSSLFPLNISFTFIKQTRKSFLSKKKNNFERTITIAVLTKPIAVQKKVPAISLIEVFDQKKIKAQPLFRAKIKERMKPIKKLELEPIIYLSGKSWPIHRDRDSRFLRNYPVIN